MRLVQFWGGCLMKKTVHFIKGRISRKHVKRYGIILLLLFILAIPIHGMWCNTALEVTHVTLETEKLPKNIDGFRIAQISDLHNAQFGENNHKLIAMLRNTKPDIIAITGDVVDASRTDIDVAIAFATEAVKIAPCYYVTGNHEAAIGNAEYERLENGLKSAGVVILRDEMIEVSQEGNIIQLIGVDDSSFTDRYCAPEAIMATKLNNLAENKDSYTVLLSHRPELFEVYCEAQVDLVLSGHAHGGQFRIPCIGGVIAPNQGLFPEYDAGIFTKDDTHMIVSRGIGNSIIPLRINNRPEIVVVNIKGK